MMEVPGIGGVDIGGCDTGDHLGPAGVEPFGIAGDERRGDDEGDGRDGQVLREAAPPELTDRKMKDPQGSNCLSGSQVFGLHCRRRGSTPRR